MAKKRYTQQQIIDAITKAEGFISAAAINLGCDIGTVYNYIKRYPAIEQVVKDVRYKQVDFVESKLLKLIKDENPTAIIFYLKTQAKDRGYIERQEITGADGGPVVVVNWDAPTDNN
jgi:hypothetical protein